MASFNHRKLLNESAVDPTVAQICGRFCDKIKNPYGICPPFCIDLCESSCKSLIVQIPPLPSPPTDDLASNYDPPDKTYRLSLFLTISLAILAISFFFFACYTIYKFCFNWYYSSGRPSQPRQPEDEESGPDDFLDVDHEPMVDHPIWYIRTIGLQPSIISAITIVKYKKGDGLVEGTECSVCLNEFQEDETLRLLPKCNHAFHIPCIDTWLRSHTNCPMCRAGIVNNTAVLPSHELIVQNSGLEEETNRVGVSDGNMEVGREEENDRDEASELRIRIEDDNESRARAQIELKMNEIFRESEGNSESDTIQPMRRSVSVDSLSASIISNAITNASPTQSDPNSNHQLVEMKESNVGIVAKRLGINQSLLRFIGSPSTERSLQMGSSSIKRSLSCSAKVFLSRYGNRSRNQVIPR